VLELEIVSHLIVPASTVVDLRRSSAAALQRLIIVAFLPELTRSFLF